MYFIELEVKHERGCQVKSIKTRRHKWLTVERMQFFPIKLSRLISVIGALILFTTFLVKEELKDHQRDLLVDIRTAQARYAEDQSTNTIINTIEDFEFIRRTEGIHENAYDPKSAASAKLRLVSDFRTLFEYAAANESAQR
jgi:hypothetical protein